MREGKGRESAKAEEEGGGIGERGPSRSRGSFPAWFPRTPLGPQLLLGLFWVGLIPSAPHLREGFSMGTSLGRGETKTRENESAEPGVE